MRYYFMSGPGLGPDEAYLNTQHVFDTLEDAEKARDEVSKYRPVTGIATA
jgi:hypothetical protein